MILSNAWMLGMYFLGCFYFGVLVSKVFIYLYLTINKGDK